MQTGIIRAKLYVIGQNLGAGLAVVENCEWKWIVFELAETVRTYGKCDDFPGVPQESASTFTRSNSGRVPQRRGPEPVQPLQRPVGRRIMEIDLPAQVPDLQGQQDT